MATSDAAERPGRLNDRLMGVVWGDDAHRHDAAVARRRRLALWGVVAVSALSALVSGLHAFAIPPFAPPDETAHIAYALSVMGGDIPFIDEFPDLRIPYMREGLSVWVANHPPLLYVLLGVPLAAMEALELPLAGFYLVRLLIVASAAVGYLLVGWFAVLLLPGRPGAAVLATGIAATVPNQLHIAGMAYGDAPGFALITGLLVAALVVLRRGVTTPRLVTLIVLAIVAANLRATGVAAAVGCLSCLALAELVHGRGAVVRRAVRGGVMAGIGGLAAAISSAWFYIGVNFVRYNSLTGSAPLLELHNREPAPSGNALRRMVDPGFLHSHLSQYWARLEADALSGPYLSEPMLVAGRWMIGLVLLAAVLVGLWRLASGAWRQPVALALCWAVAVVWLVVLQVAMADFVQSGGGRHLRYLWPAVGTFAVIAVAGLTVARRRWAALAGGVVVGYQVIAAGVVVVRLIYRSEIPAGPDTVAPAAPLRALVVEAPTAGVIVLVLVGLAALAAFAVWIRAAGLILPDDDRTHLAPDPRGWAVTVAGGRVTVRPLDVALATVAGTAAGWLVAYQLAIFVSLPLLAVGVLVAALAASAVAARHGERAGAGESPVDPASAGERPRAGPG